MPQLDRLVLLQIMMKACVHLPTILAGCVDQDGLSTIDCGLGAYSLTTSHRRVTSINQSINQSVNDTDKAINQSINQPTNQPTKQSSIEADRQAGRTNRASLQPPALPRKPSVPASVQQLIRWASLGHQAPLSAIPPLPHRPPPPKLGHSQQETGTTIYDSSAVRACGAATC